MPKSVKRQPHVLLAHNTEFHQRIVDAGFFLLPETPFAYFADYRRGNLFKTGMPDCRTASFPQQTEPGMGS